MPSTADPPLKLALNENDIQRLVFRHFRQRAARGVFAFHPKNGGVHQRGRRAGINTGLGVIPGVPDVIAVKDGKTFALELKTDSGKVGPAQTEVLERLEKAGAIVGIAHGLDAALRWLEQHQLLVGRAL
jgi:hypothetical protein